MHVNFAEDVRVTSFLGQPKCFEAGVAGSDEVGAGNLELAAVHLEQNSRAHVTEDDGDLARFIERACRGVPLFQIRVQLPHVVEDAAHLAGGSQLPELAE